MLVRSTRACTTLFAVLGALFAGATCAANDIEPAGPLHFGRLPACFREQPPPGEMACVPPLPDETLPAEVRARAHLGRGEGLAARGEHGRAQEELDRALALAPDLAQAWHFAARLKLTQGRYDAARPDLDRALVLDPRDDAALATRAYLTALTGEFGTAFADYEAALAINPRSVFALAQRIEMEAGIKDWSARDRDLERLAAIDPHHPLVGRQRIAAATEGGDLATAIAEVDALLARGASATPLVIKRASLNQMAGRHEAAIRDLTSILGAPGETPRQALGPRTGQLYFARATSFHALKRGEEARADVVRALAIGDAPMVLRLQVYLRHKLFETVDITGRTSPELVEAASACMLNPACGRGMTKPL